MRMKRAIILPMLVLFGSCLYIGTFLYLIVIEESQGMLYQHLYLVLHCAFSVRIIPCIAALIHRLWSNRVKNENGFFAINRTHNFLFGTSVPSPVELKVWGKIFAQTEKRASCNAYEFESFESTLFAVKKYESKHEAEKQTFCSATNERGLALKWIRDQRLTHNNNNNHHHHHHKLKIIIAIIVIIIVALILWLLMNKLM